MKNQLIYSLLLALLFACGNSNEKSNEQSADSTRIEVPTNATEQLEPLTTEVTFESLDGLMISATVYSMSTDKAAGTILLCHQAGYNRHEYDEIGIKLAEQGINCIAIDQRSGGILNGYVNETADRAIDFDIPLKYVDAEQDIIAGINYAYEKYNKPLILWGSSYSAGLALHIGQDNEKLKAVIAFSPGDYFEDRKPPLKSVMKNYPIPFFITSAKNEGAAITTILENTALDKNHVHFIPSKQGKHGSKALWSDHENNAEYWDALNNFFDETEF